ncbi:MAG TPA: ligase-associated DNA damage response endonuclease PdeM [Kiritimatiellia bacterium]|nr:ligase-associated DNA damage response endonuclease PdeM [Kiritimatiellia bacterium]HMO99177.1 ligase-associated DNA damage response endonuclease PdeM [Kiritimatiellia bacterium]HMP95764.1 ligase-associated DNA damage response endonuclease PdeM [Kiritimatiellia bacterium]
MKVSIAGHLVELLPEKAAWLEATRTLLVADVHVGKESHFHAHAIPVPPGMRHDDLARLSRLLAARPARRLVVLGDWIHSRHALTPEVERDVTAWRTRQAGVEVVLVRGNHDRGAGRLPASWKISECDRIEEHEWVFRHEPDTRKTGFVFCGHQHPCVRLGYGRGPRERLPCFVLRPRELVLPAFGSFTGGHPVWPGRGRRIFAVTDSSVLEVGEAPNHEPGPDDYAPGG